MFENYGFQMQALTILMQIKGYLLCNFKISDCWKIGRIISDSCPILVWILKSFLQIVPKEWFSQMKNSTQNWFARTFFLLISDTIQTIKLQIFFSLLISKPRFDHENLNNLLNLSAHLITNSSVFLAKGNFRHFPFFRCLIKKTL